MPCELRRRDSTAGEECDEVSGSESMQRDTEPLGDGGGGGAMGIMLEFPDTF